jgi:outer membrane lipoprotein SlyB
MQRLPDLRNCHSLSLSRASLAAALMLALAGCRADYSPDTYATRAVQQANKVEQGMVVGRRDVAVTAEGSTGAATGAAAGGVLGAQTPGGGIAAALGGVGGALVGGIIGTTAEHVAGDTRAFEYIVRTAKEELISVTQRDTTPLVVGQRVLVISGNQARIVPDYTTQPPATPAAAAAASPRPTETVVPVAAPANRLSTGGAGAAPPPPAPPVLVPAPPPPPTSEAPASQPAAQSAVGDAAQSALIGQLPPIAQGAARALAP